MLTARFAGSESVEISIARRFSQLGTVREPQRSPTRAAALAIGDAQPAAVGFDDFAAQCQAQSRAGLLGGVERHQRVLERGRRESRAAIAHLDGEAAARRAMTASSMSSASEPDSRAFFEQVDQRLLDLRGVEAGGALRRRARERELRRPTRSRLEQDVPRHRRERADAAASANCE